ncbi:MAG: hypothetical protein MK085_06615 [Phycisphaerales bacterium]|nr:hypothetical protein [Phycisphaerales bacterium]
MSNHDYDIDLSTFDEFAEADLLDLVEGTMDPDRALELAHAVKVRDPNLLRRLIRMQADRMELSAHGDPVAPSHLLDGVQSRLHDEDLVEGDFLETLEPTAMMARAVEDLDRRRRQKLYRGPIMAGVAASLAIIGVGVIISAWSMLGQSRSQGTGGFGQGMAESVRPPAQEMALAEYGLMLKGMASQDVEPALAAISQEGELVLVRNLTVAESVSASGDEGMASAGGNGEHSTRSALVEGLQPAPLVGDATFAPSTRTRVELAERGYRWAVVVDRDEAAQVVERIGRLAGNAGLVAARAEPSNALESLGAWRNWQPGRVTSSPGSGNAKRIIVPIAIIDFE